MRRWPLTTKTPTSRPASRTRPAESEFEIFATSSDTTDKTEVSYIVDPVTWTPLEDTLLDNTGAVVERSTILSLTTTATMPANPYTP